MWNDPNLIKILQEGSVAVMPTDTIYGIVGSALNKNTVKHIYELRERSPEKPCIILLGDTSDLKKLSISLTAAQKSELSKIWPGPVSVILDCNNPDLEYLHRGTNTLAVRLPGKADLRELILKTGPLIAPSANKEGLPPAKNTEEAKKYFGDSVNLYVDTGDLAGSPSRLIRLHLDGSTNILRE